MAFNSKKALALALSAAMIVTAAPMSSFNVEAAAATKAVKGTSKITVSAKKATIKVGAKKTIKVTLNKKQTKALKVTLKSSNAKVAKVAKSVTVKKGKKVASFKITGVKKGTATITASFKTSANKTKKATVKVTVKKAAATKVAVTGVALSTTTPKVGDTITATVAPSNATNVTYAWYTGDSSTALNSQIAGQTGASLAVTSDMLGKFIGVVVSGDNNSTANATTVAAVAEADAADIRIVSAEQTGAKTIKATFANPVTASDKLTVKKGSNEVKIDGAIEYAADFKSAIITLADKIITTEYEVILTPEDTKIAASSAKFTGEISELKEIKFLNNYLVMKDQYYNEGYCYVKGYDQFGGEVTLSGLQVTSGVGKYQSYDNTTGKITIKDDSVKKDTDTGAFLLIKEVPVFVQYQQGNNMIVNNANLTVSTQAYLSEVEFGNVEKDGTKRKDGKMTVTELRSGKYYLELNSVKDQYGNDLSADDLNKQREETKTLFVIPNEDGAYYSTGKFGTLNKKTILWLKADTKNNAKPGTMALTLTGAGGKTFTKDIEVAYDPCIDTLNVVYPELYKAKESDAFEFSAVDQYGDPIELWDVKPHKKDNTTLQFDDENGMTGKKTEITVSNANFNDVKYDSSKKTFKVTVTPTGDAKAMVVFTVQTANMKVSTHSITIGEASTPAKIKSTLKGDTTQLAMAKVGGDNSYNFNKNIQIEDVNGNTMSRGDDNYPSFVPSNTISGSAVTALDTNEKADGKFFWSLSKNKVSGGAVDSLSGDDGVAYYADVVGAKGTNKSQDFYVTLYQKTNANHYYVVDDESFRLTAVVAPEAKSHSVKVDGSIYAVVGSTDDAEIKVTETTKNGETYEIDGSRITLNVGGQFKDNGANKVVANVTKNFADNTTDKVDVTVYVDGVEKETVQVPYSNVDPKATAAKFKYYAQDGPATSRVGKGWDADSTDDDFTPIAGAKFTIKDGKLEITNVNSLGDKIEAFVEDQYGQAMKNTTFTKDGKEIKNGDSVRTTVKENNGRTAIQFKNDKISKKFYVTDTDDVFKFDVTNTAATVSAKDTGLTSAIAKAADDASTANTIEVADNTTTTATNFTLNAEDKVVIPAGITWTITGSAQNVVINGTIDVKGTLEIGAGVKITGTGTFTGTGTVNNYGTVAANVINMTVSSTWHSKAGSTTTVGTLKGYADLESGSTTTATNTTDAKNVKVEAGATNDLGDVTGSNVELGNGAALKANKMSSDSKLTVDKNAKATATVGDQTNEFDNSGKTTDYVAKAETDASGATTYTAVSGEATVSDDIVVEEISVATAPTKGVTYNSGDTFSPVGLILTVNTGAAAKTVPYDDTTKADFTFSPSLDKKLTASDTKVTITYYGKSVDLDITVKQSAAATLATCSAITTSNPGITLTGVNVSGRAVLVDANGAEVAESVVVSKNADNTYNVTAAAGRIKSGATYSVKFVPIDSEADYYSAFVSTGSVVAGPATIKTAAAASITSSASQIVITDLTVEDETYGNYLGQDPSWDVVVSGAAISGTPTKAINGGKITYTINLDNPENGSIIHIYTNEGTHVLKLTYVTDHWTADDGKN